MPIKAAITQVYQAVNEDEGGSPKQGKGCVRLLQEPQPIYESIDDHDRRAALAKLTDRERKLLGLD